MSPCTTPFSVSRCWNACRAGAHVLIMSHDHAEDFALCDAALRLPQLGSIGLIGSSSKWTGFRRRARRDGSRRSGSIARITSPIGLPGIDGKEPAVIAVGVAAALILAMQTDAAAAAARTAAARASASPVTS